MNDLFKDFKIQPTKLRGDNMEIKQKALDGLNEITYDTKTEISAVTLAHTYRPCIDLYDGDEHIAHYENDKKFIEDFKRIKQENKQLKEQLKATNKGLRKVIKRSVKWQRKWYKQHRILDKLEKWLNDLGNWIVLEKLQDLKGESNDTNK